MEVCASVVIHAERKDWAERNDKFLRALWKAYPGRMERARAPRPKFERAKPYQASRPHKWQNHLQKLEEARETEFVHAGPVGKSIIASVAKAFGMEPSDLAGRRRQHEIMRARFVAYRLLRDVSMRVPDENDKPCWKRRFSTPQIGMMLGRDHSTIVYGLQQFDMWVERDEEMAHVYKALRRELAGAGHAP